VPELIGAYQLGLLSRSQPPLPELVVSARAHAPECTTAAERARVEPQWSAGTPALSNPGLGIRFAGGGVAW